MPDKERVMKALSICSESGFDDCKKCPYWEYADCNERLCADALALLKDQEAMIAVACDVLETYAPDAACDEFSEDAKQWEICEKDCGHGHYSKCWKRFLKWKLEKRL